MLTTAENDASAMRLPDDVRVIGFIHVLSGFALLARGLLIILGVLPPGPDLGVPTLFGAIWITTRLGKGIEQLIIAPLALIRGYGLLRGRAFGWWLYTIALVELTYDWIAYGHVRPLMMVPILVLNALQGAWLIYRWRLFRPFSFLKRSS